GCPFKGRLHAHQGGQLLAPFIPGAAFRSPRAKTISPFSRTFLLALDGCSEQVGVLPAPPGLSRRTQPPRGDEAVAWSDGRSLGAGGGNSGQPFHESGEIMGLFDGIPIIGPIAKGIGDVGEWVGGQLIKGVEDLSGGDLSPITFLADGIKYIVDHTQ